MLPRTSIRSQELGSRVNRGAACCLEIPVCFILQGHKKCVVWAEEKINDADKTVVARFKRGMENAI